MLNLGVVRTSLKENERRLPIHPDHLDWITDEVRRYMIFERGYGEPFGIEDGRILRAAGGMASRDEILERCDIVVIPKPSTEDLKRMRENGVLWGWSHFVQQREFTQAAIERRLTAIAWESMHHWDGDGRFQTHVFHKNNEIAGYAGVLDAMRLRGISGRYGPVRRAVVISFGSVSRGAVYALLGQGFEDITVLTADPARTFGRLIPGVRYREIRDDVSERPMIVNHDGSLIPLVEELAVADIIVNGICQDPNRPMMFIREEEIGRLKRGCLIIDVSCDLGMGFPFARPTTFEEPIINVGEVNYYAVDHTPSYLWDSATWEISKALIPFLPVVMGGERQWDENMTIRRAIEVRSGMIENPSILSFQRRRSDYPHTQC